VVRAVEAERIVVAVVVANPPGVHRRGRPPYHLFAIRTDASGWVELSDDPPYCFFGIK
jgi:hypothetical protein